MQYFQPLLELAQDYLSESQISIIEKAYILAESAHDGQFRSSGEPYITHPVAVACILAKLKLDHLSLTSAVLHDVIEDTPITKEEIAAQFGDEVAEIVDGLSKLDKLRFTDQKEAQAENYRKMILAMVQDMRVILIKLADRIHNMRTLGALRPDKRRRIAKETLEIFAPLAHRLGIHDIKNELEDLGFKALYPNRSHVLTKVLETSRGQRKEVISSILNEIKAQLTEQNIKANVYGREKNPYSIYHKMQNKSYKFESILDIYAFRIIVDNIDTCYRVLGQMHRLYQPRPGKFKDYISIPKANGYQSLHTSMFGANGVPVEIQIRTEDMETMADKGIAAHWSYKSHEDANKGMNTTQIKAQRWMENLLELQQNTGNSIEFIENVKSDLFAEEMYVFTPDGNIIELPQNATAIDFAYALHSDIGNSCIGAKVDKEHYPLSSPLRSGQTIEILSAPGARPNASWLNFIVTPLARSRVQYALRNIRKEESIIIGKRLLNTSLGDYSIDDISQHNIDDVLKSFNIESLDELYIQLAHGKLMSLVIARRMLGDSQLLSDESGDAEAQLIIRGTNGLMTNFAQCCYPIPPDPIIAHMSSKKGITIHNERCPLISAQAKDTQQYMNVQWCDTIEQDFKARLKITAHNEQGCLAEITRLISLSNSSIYNIVSKSTDQFIFNAELVVSVKNKIHLDELINRLKNSPKTLHIDRVLKPSSDA